MTEQEKLRKAKRWMDCLANGIHPLTGEVLPDGDVVNDVKISRCLFFVAEILRRQLDEHSEAHEWAREAPFEIAFKDSEKDVISAQPISISILARNINELVRVEGIKKIQYTHIVNWLIKMGFLEERLRSDGRMCRRPTLKGEQLGISLESRTGKNGPYQVVVYNEEAQRFIVGNINEIFGS